MVDYIASQYLTTLSRLANLGQTAPTLTDAWGALLVNSETTVATYGTSGLVNAQAAATDIVNFAGPSSGYAKIYQVGVSFITATPFQIIRRSTANTGGVGGIVAGTLYDTTSPAKTSVIISYTANPVLGTGLGGFVAGALAASTMQTFNFGALGQPIIIRTGEFLCITLASGNGAGQAGFFFRWAEF